MKKSIYCLVIILIAFLQLSYSQDTIYLKNALFIKDAYHYGREAVYTDELAYQLYNNSLQKPRANAEFDNNGNGNVIRWQPIKADGNNVFKNVDSSRNRYLYFAYDSNDEQTVLLNTIGSSSIFVNGILHAGDPYSTGWLYIPVALKKGLNEIYVRAYGETTVRIIKPRKPAFLSVKDLTLPDIVLDEQDNLLQAAIVVINTTQSPLVKFKITSTLAGKETTTELPFVPAMSSRKVIFNIDSRAINKTGKYNCKVKLTSPYITDERTITLQAVNREDRHNNTFVSDIDSSLQYYAVTPQHGGNTAQSALFLSLHGAGVEASGQAAAYDYKNWGTLVAPTNRRPRGFNWEDWGRLDALEVLRIAQQKYMPDSSRIYLTGHSMGGHGTWFLGATYPDKWAAIAPCSGYPSLKDYGSADGKIPDSSTLPAERMLLRASNQSNVLNLIPNYQTVGVYVLHGDADRVVPVQFARQMRDSLNKFHSDFAYHEEPGGEHWWSNQSVDYPALFDFFKDHQRQPDTSFKQIDFITANPNISSSFRWASIIQQTHPMEYSSISLRVNNRKDTIIGTTKNVELLRLNLKGFRTDKPLIIKLDNAVNIKFRKSVYDDSVYFMQYNGNWVSAAPPRLPQKNPLRYGTFKEAFNNQMVFVFSTSGTEEENYNTFTKAVYDAETWYYRGNGSVEIIPDKLYTPSAYRGRNIIIYGNATTNSAWNTLLANCPLQVTRGRVTAGNNTWTGDDLAAYFVWPQADPLTSVGVVAGTGIRGMKAAAGNQYFAGGSGYPDFMVFSLSMLKDGARSIKLAGYFNNNWELSNNEMVQTE